MKKSKIAKSKVILTYNLFNDKIKDVNVMLNFKKYLTLN